MEDKRTRGLLLGVVVDTFSLVLSSCECCSLSLVLFTKPNLPIVLNMRRLRINEVGEQLGVTGQSVRRYVNDGRLKCDYTPSGQRVFTQEYVDEFLGKTPTPVYAYYVRSSSGDKELLASQKEQLIQSFGVT